MWKMHIANSARLVVFSNELFGEWIKKAIIIVTYCYVMLEELGDSKKKNYAFLAGGIKKM